MGIASSSKRTTTSWSSTSQQRTKSSRWRELRLDPFPAYNFFVEINGLIVGNFSEVSGLEGQIETEDYREGGVNGYVHHFPKQTTYSNLVLKKGVTSLGTMWDWFEETTRGIVRRRSGSIIMLDRDLLPIMWWNFSKAYPIKWTGPEFNATNDEVGFESIELVHEGISKPLLGQLVAMFQQT